MEVIKDRSFLLAERYVNETGVSLFLTGKAGTGKTTFLKSIVENCHKRCAVVAPTGVAAINAGGVTIHSFFQLPLCLYLPDVKELVTEYQLPEKKTRLKKERIALLRSLDLLIIDEVSMVRADILDAIDYTLRRFRRNDRPFGGVQLLMIGDVQQLPPFIREDERRYYEQVYPSPFFFHSKALQKTPYLTIELETVYRQRSARFVDILNDVRSGRPSRETLELLNSRYDPSFEPPQGESWIRLTTHNALADETNVEKLKALKGKSKSFKAVTEGNFPESMYPGETNLELKVGAQVMFIRNNAMSGYHNGKIGTVTSLEPSIIVTDEEGNDFEVADETWEIIKYSVNEANGEIEASVDGSFKQLPLRLAWAITIHKSQGLTFDKVIIDAGAAFSFGQVYVALSRCRSLEGMVLASRITSGGFFRDDYVLGFEASFTNYSQAEDSFEAHKRAQYIQTLCDAFCISELKRLHAKVVKIYQFDLPTKFKSNAKLFSSLEDPSLEKAQDKPFAGLKELHSVSERFMRQLRYLAAQIPEHQECPSDELKQRIAKGAVYYSDQLTFLAAKLLPLLKIEISNKDTKKLFNDAAAQLLQELHFRLKAFSQIIVKGFNSQDFLRLRTKLEANAPRTLLGHIRALHDIVEE